MAVMQAIGVCVTALPNFRFGSFIIMLYICRRKTKRNNNEKDFYFENA